MFIVRAPLRVSLGGGGTDLPTYYRKYGGFVLSAAIDKYVYVTVHESFRPQITLKYSKSEEVDSVDQIEHPIIREALRLEGIKDSFDLANVSDVPTNTGLGSSGSFTVALLKALHVFKGKKVTREALAEQAYHIEREILGQPVGKQDQYISALGGITRFEFRQDDTVRAVRLLLDPQILQDLNDNLLLFFTGYSRSASAILKDQDDKSETDDKEMINNLYFIKESGIEIKNALVCGNLKLFALLMDLHWKRKLKRRGMSNSHINELYQLGKDNGALGGKLVGAGGGGFLMFYAEDRELLRKTMSGAGLRELPFKFDLEGVKVIHS